jgi:hypothetical protein
MPNPAFSPTAKPSSSRSLVIFRELCCGAVVREERETAPYAATHFSERMLVLENREYRDDEVNPPVS